MPKQDLDWDKDDFPRKRSRRRDDKDDDDEEDDQPRKPKRRVKARRPSSLPLVIGLLLGGVLLLLVVGGVAAMFLWKGGMPGGNAVVNNPLSLTPVVPQVVRPPLPPGWVDFKHPECNLSIYCPRQMVPDEFYSQQPFGTPLEASNRGITKGFHSPPPVTTLPCSVYVSEHHPQFSASARDLRQKATISFEKNTAISRDVVWGGRPAWEVSGARVGSPETRVVSRRLWVGNRFYMANLHGTDGHPTAAEQSAFFDSFVLGE